MGKQTLNKPDRDRIIAFVGVCGAAYGIDSFLRRPPHRPMKTAAPNMNDAHQSSRPREQDAATERFKDEQVMHLERDQFVAETSRPVPRAH